jgi:preprotein translocase subunit SecA
MTDWQQRTAVQRTIDFINRLRGNYVQYDLRPYTDHITAINNLAPELSAQSNQSLQSRAAQIRTEIENGRPPADLLHETFAIVREAAHRIIGLRPYDVQLIGGIGLFEGKLVEMQTGEGKTLAAVLPAVLQGMTGKGIHILTFNDYLAGRDAAWMGPVYEFLGVRVGHIEQGMSYEERRAAYRADVTYLTAKEAGFDFLRDGLAYETGQLVQRPFHAAIVDEADSIMIDEARIPLVIAGVMGMAVAGGPNLLEERLHQMRAIVQRLRRGRDYGMDGERRNVFLTEYGAQRVEGMLQVENIFTEENLPLLTEINLALHAEALVRRDVDYIVRDGRVEIVDDFTGRVITDRQWPYGLQAAIEVKEGLQTAEDAHVLGSVTLQHFLGHYPHLSGMTATAATSADEFEKFYKLDVVVVPPNRPCIRDDMPDRIFTHRWAKQRALVDEIAAVHKTGRPVLVGTLTVVESERLAAALHRAGINCNVLNAKHDADEARIVAEAGALGAVTIATNMAGRGTDIVLGGASAPEPVEGGASTSSLSRSRSRSASEEVRTLGGLYVIGTNRHESRRIDNQLRGRSGRQGDPGASVLYISLEDDIMVRYGIENSIAKYRMPERQDGPVNDPLLERIVQHIQRVIEGQNYDIRQMLYKYTNFVDKQRQIIFKMRGRVLLADVSTGSAADAATSSLSRSASPLPEPVEGGAPTGFLAAERPEKYRQAVQLWGAEFVADLERRLRLQAIDGAWSEHLEAVSEIRDGIHLMEIGGLSPVNEFHKRAKETFDEALDSVEDRLLEAFEGLEITAEPPDLSALGLLGPASTWTYLVDDHAMSNPLLRALRRFGLG